MSPTPDNEVRNADDLRAQEYLLGLLDAAEDRDFEQTLHRSPSLARHTSRYALLFARSLMAETEAQQVPAWLQARITRDRDRLDAHVRPEAGGSRLWRVAAAVVAMLGLILIIGATGHQTERFAPTREVQVAMNQADTPSWAVRADMAHHRVAVTVTRTGRIPAGRAPVLWVITKTGQTIPLGRVSTHAGQTMTLNPAVYGTLQNSRIALSLEPKSAYVGLKPKGPVVFVGHWQPIRAG